MECASFQYSNHAVAQMFKRQISADEVEATIRAGDKIKNYPDDAPHPSCLLLAIINGRPIHVVVSQNHLTGVCYVITAYEPDPVLWNFDFTSKI